MTHPLTDELIDSIAQFNSDLGAEEIRNRDHDMRAAADWQLEQVIDAWEDAFHSDLEHGVRSLNDKAARELATKYPRIFAFGQVLAAMRPQEDTP